VSLQFTKKKIRPTFAIKLATLLCNA